MMKRFLIFLFCYFIFSPFSVVYGASGVRDLASHRVVYDLYLSPDGVGSSVGSISPSLIFARGRMVARISGSSCEGWQTDIRSLNYFLRSFGSLQFVDWSMQSWESGDGLQLYFSSDRFVNGSRSSVRGFGEVSASDLSGHVRFDHGGRGDFLLRSGTVFPVGHTLSILSSARSGLRISRSRLYEGSEDNEVYQAVTFIGPRREDILSSSLSSFSPMRGMASWFISTSYFEEAPFYSDSNNFSDDSDYDRFSHPGDRLPVYRIEATLYDNGVFDNLLFDYGDFSLRGVLSEIEFISSVPCD